MTATRTPITVHGCATHPRYQEATELALGPLPGNPVVTVTFPDASGPYTVHVAIEVADRGSGELRWFGFSEQARAHMPVLHILRNLLTRAQLHEIEENIYASGVRVFDPHAGEVVAVPCG